MTSSLGAIATRSVRRHMISYRTDLAIMSAKSTGARRDTGFLTLEDIRDDDIIPVVSAAMTSFKNGLYVLFKQSVVVDAAFLDVLGTLYGQVALREPCFNLVPLMPQCGWSKGV